MLGNFALYMKHGFGFAKAFRLAFGITVRDFAINTALVVLILALLTALIIGALNMIEDERHQSYVEQAAYVKALESIVAACLSDSTGKPVTIGDELYLCGIVSTGVKI